jgi:hypothetical protein
MNWGGGGRPDSYGVGHMSGLVWSQVSELAVTPSPSHCPYPLIHEMTARPFPSASLPSSLLRVPRRSPRPPLIGIADTP